MPSVHYCEGGSLIGGGSLSRGVSVWGVSVQGGLPDRDSPPPVNRITNRCKKHYLAATLLCAVKSSLKVQLMDPKT